MCQVTIGIDRAVLGLQVHLMVHYGNVETSRVSADGKAEQDDLHHGQCENEQHHPFNRHSDLVFLH